MAETHIKHPISDYYDPRFVNQDPSRSPQSAKEKETVIKSETPPAPSHPPIPKNLKK